MRVKEYFKKYTVSGDCTTTTASNIVSAGMQLMQLHAEIGAYEMARDVSRLK